MPWPHAAVAAVALTFWCGGSAANESAASEISHVFSGAAIAAGATAIADHYGVEDRRWVGFATCVGISAVIEGVQILTTGSDQVGRSTMDFTFNLAGAAIGAWVTDRYLLMPVVTRDAEGRRVVGLAMRKSF